MTQSMQSPMLVRFFEPSRGKRLGVIVDDVVADVTDYAGSIAAWLRASAGRVEAAIADMTSAARNAAQRYPLEHFDHAPGPDSAYLLAPVDLQDVWAAGVTYERSRIARQEESVDGGDVYARVYEAERPELFFKARGPWVVGQRAAVGIRRDATWNVPEPELTLVLNPALEVVGLTIGNDMSSRDIEGANPLYLPQAKVYTASCAIGPGIALGAHRSWPSATIRVTVERSGKVVFEDSVHTDRIRRRMDELINYLGRSNTYPDGVLLMTGTGIVPSADFTLRVDDVIRITIDGIGTLMNTVKVV